MIALTMPAAGFELIDVGTPTLLKRFDTEGPVCLTGAKTYRMSAEQVVKWRAAYAGLKNAGFVGIDIEEGSNVDVVADLCDPGFPRKQADLCGRFGMVICGALLEHVKNPFEAAANVQALLKPGGQLYFQGPWVWGYHSYPDDYWRISFSGLRLMFPRIEWLDWWYFGTTKGVGIRIDNPLREREIFQETAATLTKAGRHITDRAMPYLSIGAVGRLVGR
jgi:SAM-dependent methyltransferase